jgi:hypothetical protein
MGNVGRRQAQLAADEDQRLRAARRHFPELVQDRVVGADGFARQDAGQHGGALVNAEEVDGLLDRLGLARGAVERRIGQFQQGARHAHVVAYDARDGARRRVGLRQFALQVDQQAGTRRNADRAQQRIFCGRIVGREADSCCCHFAS